MVGVEWPFEEIETQIFMRAAHVSPSQKPPLAKAEPKRQAQRKKGTIHTLVFFSQSGSPAPNVFSREARRRGGSGVERQSRQTDTKRPCVNAVALSLKITNTKIICNLSGPQHTRSAPLATPTILAVCDSDTFWFDVRAFRGFSCMKGVGRAPQPHKEPLCQSGL